MTDENPLSKFVARPGQSLEEHLEGVSTGATQFVGSAGENPYGDDWTEVLKTVSWVHDIGKLTEYFQDYVRSDGNPRSELTNHGTVSAFVSVLALHARGFETETIAAGFYAVAKHHSVLQNIEADFAGYHQDTSDVDGRYDTAQKQFENIDDSAAGAANKVITRATEGEADWDTLEDMSGQGLGTIRGTICQLHERFLDEEFYGCALRLWSTLVAADKFDASGLSSLEEFDGISNPERPSATALSNTVRELSDTVLPDGETTSVYLDNPDRELPADDATLEQRLNAIRAAANGRAAENLLAGHQRGDRVFELTLPTGFGKTYTGLRAALELAEERDSRVIYALPYTSIIDQVDEEVRDVFGLEPLDPAYTKHHHLADTRTLLSQQDSFHDRPSSGRETLHAEAWQSGLVLTTFTQLFESVAGPGNVQSTKLPSLQDSIIIADEPQALPHEWWALVGRLTTFLADEYDATMLFMTATQPRLLQQLSGVPDPEPLVGLQSESAQLIGDAPRVEFDLHPSLADHLTGQNSAPLPITEASEEIVDELSGTSNALSVVNTVGCAVSLTKELTNPDRVGLGAELLPYLREKEGEPFDPDEYLRRLDDEHPNAEAVVTALTTRLRPADRRAMLDCLGRILDSDASTPFDGRPTITVSTQLIEAGVDLSFDRLYRDYAPLPSLVQAAGRCNRRFGGDVSSVTVWRLDSPPEEDYVPSWLIYEKEQSLLRPTKHALSALREEADSATLPESSMITTGVDRYYEWLHSQRRTGDRSDDLVGAFDEAKGKVLRNASLIGSDYPTRDFVVLATDSEVDDHKSYLDQKSVGDWEGARGTFQRLKQNLVSVPTSTEVDEDEPTVIDAIDDPDAYDLVTGRGVVRPSVRDDSEV